MSQNDDQTQTEGALPTEAPVPALTEAPAVVETAVPEAPEPNANMVSEVLVPVLEPWHPAHPTLCLHADTTARTAKKINELPLVAPESDDDGHTVYYTYQEADKTKPVSRIMERTLEREGEWVQKVPSEAGPLAISRPILGEPGPKLTGERGMIHVRHLLGLGTTVTIPLWHTGIWVSLKAPSELEILELHRRLGDEKVKLGRETHGLVFGNRSVFMNEILAEFALDHLYSSTLVEDSVETLKKTISTLDLPTLIWGMACTIWPNGFQYARVVTRKNEAGELVMEHRKSRIDVKQLQWTHKDSLTPFQIRHMTERKKSMTAESIVRYKAEFERGQNRRVRLNDVTELELHVPSIDDYIKSGHDWIYGITNMVEKAFKLAPSNERRDSFITEHASATYFRQYAHWIKKIILHENHVVEDRADVDETIDMLSGMIGLRNGFFQEIITFIEDATISAIGTPIESELDEPRTLPRLTRVLPMDVTSSFFILLSHKAQVLRMVKEITETA